MHEGQMQTYVLHGVCLVLALTRATLGKALSESQPSRSYWGKPAVRNDRGERGNNGMTGRRLAPTRPRWLSSDPGGWILNWGLPIAPRPLKRGE